jgi:gamma-glutamylcyclotransferase (GGCT)/AIG2-like uncharacterized protein YtfP
MNNKINFFAYGTLLFKELWNNVVGENDYKRILSFVKGYSIYKIKNEVYPGIIKSTEYDVVYGMTYLNIDENIIKTLDHFEGEYYERKKINIANTSYNELECFAYFIKPEYYKLLSKEKWDPLWFKENGFDEFKKYIESKKVTC